MKIGLRFKQGILAIIIITAVLVLYSINLSRNPEVELKDRKTSNNNLSVFNDDDYRPVKSKSDLSSMADQSFSEPSLESFNQKIAEARLDPNIQSRSTRMRDLILEMSREGLTNEAWQIVEVEESGSVRDAMIIGFFVNAGGLPEESIVSKMLSLSEKGDDEDLSAAINGYLYSLAPSEVNGFLLRDDFSGLRNDLLNSAKDRFQADVASYYRVGMLENGPNAHRSYIESANSAFARGFISAGDFCQIAEAASGISAFEKWQMISNLDTADDKAFEHFKGEIVKEVVVSNPKEAINTLMNEEHVAPSDIKLAFETWGRIEPNGAFRWWESNNTELPAKNRDLAAAAFAHLAADKGDSDTALEWAKQISDPGVQSNLIGEIETNER